MKSAHFQFGLHTEHTKWSYVSLDFYHGNILQICLDFLCMLPGYLSVCTRNGINFHWILMEI